MCGDLIMKTITLQHGSPEWLAFRTNGIGGSDASAIFGENPYKTNVDLWREKCGMVAPKTVTCAEAVEYGKNAEKYLVGLFALDYPQYKVTQQKKTVYVHDNGFMFASLDGLLTEKKTKEKGILETKTSLIFASMAREKWKNGIPQNYFIQVLHYLAVTGFSYAYLKAQLKNTDDSGETRLSTWHYPIKAADFKDEIGYLIEKETEFWNCVTHRKQPNLIIKSF